MTRATEIFISQQADTSIGLTDAMSKRTSVFALLEDGFLAIYRFSENWISWGAAPGYINVAPLGLK
jgi:hypothetical protein